MFYYKKDVVDDLPMQSSIKMELKDFAVKPLAPDVTLTTYMVIKYKDQNNEKHYSLRSSIWRLKDDKWQMVFHQGTPTKLPFKRVAVVDIK